MRSTVGTHLHAAISSTTTQRGCFQDWRGIFAFELGSKAGDGHPTAPVPLGFMYKVSTFWEGGCPLTAGKLTIVVAAAGALARTQAEPRRSSLGRRGPLSRLRKRGQIFFFPISSA